MLIVEQSHQILTPIDEEGIYKSIELAGRTAYKSEYKMTADSAEKFILSIISMGHESVIEHISLSVKFITDRGVTHELVRHRLCAYTQESTRYCNYASKDISFIRPVFWGINDINFNWWIKAMEQSEVLYNSMMLGGAKPQEARTVLPNSLKTEIVTTANLREWRHILKLRTAKDAHPQMRALMLPLLKELKVRLPLIFKDIGEIVEKK
jgi:thymidylate synthase (FAD)